ADLMDLWSELANGGKGLGFDLVADAGGEADGAKHTQLVFRKTKLGRADGADQAVFEIGLAANIIEHLDGDGIEQEAVDGEVAALNVEPRFRGILDAIRMATIRVGSIAAIGGNLDGVVVANSISTISEDGDEYDAELGTEHTFLGIGA